MALLPRAFETASLVARLPVVADAALIFSAYTNNPLVSRYMMWRPHESQIETEEFIAGCIKAAEEEKRFPYILAVKGTPADPIGMLEARPSGHTIDLGYVLAPTHWGKGYMPEAVRSLSEWALAQERFFRVQAFCDVENRPSQRTLEKAGFTREGRHERFIVHPNLSPEPRPCYMYARFR